MEDTERRLAVVEPRYILGLAIALVAVAISIGWFAKTWSGDARANVSALDSRLMSAEARMQALELRLAAEGPLVLRVAAIEKHIDELQDDEGFVERIRNKLNKIAGD